MTEMSSNMNYEQDVFQSDKHFLQFSTRALRDVTDRASYRGAMAHLKSYALNLNIYDSKAGYTATLIA